MNVRLDTMLVKKRMGDKRMTNTELARLMGISRQAVSMMMGRGTCSHINAALIADALGMEFEDIVKED